MLNRELAMVSERGGGVLMITSRSAATDGIAFTGHSLLRIERDREVIAMNVKMRWTDNGSAVRTYRADDDSYYWFCDIATGENEDWVLRGLGDTRELAEEHAITVVLNKGMLF